MWRCTLVGLAASAQETEETGFQVLGGSARTVTIMIAVSEPSASNDKEFYRDREDKCRHPISGELARQREGIERINANVQATWQM